MNPLRSEDETREKRKMDKKNESFKPVSYTHLARERKGVSSIQKKAYEYVLDHEMDMLVKSEFGRLQLAMMRQVLTGERRCEEKIRKQLDRIEPLEKAADTMEVIRTIDDCYNAWVDPGFEQIHGDLSKVLAVKMCIRDRWLCARAL